MDPTRQTTPRPYELQTSRAGRCVILAHPSLTPFVHSASALERLCHEASTRVYKKRPHRVQEIQLPTDCGLSWSRLVLKRFGWRGLQHYILSPLKQAPAHRAYQTACHLLAHGLGTPLPVAVLETRNWGFLQYNSYVTEAIGNAVTLRAYCRTLPEGLEGLEEVMRLTATYVRCMHDSGMWHRDLVLANFLLTGRRGSYRLYLVDLNRARRVPTMPLYLRAIDVARMDWRQWQPQFCRFYCADRFGTEQFFRMIRLYGHWRTWRRNVLNILRPWRPWQRWRQRRTRT